MATYECPYCGTRNSWNCCAGAERVYKERLVALFQNGGATREMFEEMAAACAKVCYEQPEALQNINNQIGRATCV